MNIIKEFLAYRRAIKSFSLIDLTDNDKRELEAVEKEIIKKIINLSVISLSREMIDWKLSSEYVNWAKQWMMLFASYFRKYNIK